MMKFRRTIAQQALVVTLLAGALTTLTACNTVNGVGQDVSAGGRAVSNSAEKVKQGL